MEETSDIVITFYKKEYYKDLVENGYYSHFNTYLKPDFLHMVKNLLNLAETKRLVNRTFFLNKEEITLVAYSNKDKKAVGSMTFRKVTENLWAVWSGFVSPAYRGKGLGPLLVDESAKLLKPKNAEKIIAIIAKNNVKAVKAWTKVTDSGFLDSKIFKCVKNGSIAEHVSGKTSLRKLRAGEDRQLFDIFELCVGKQWYGYMEIDQENFLERIHGPWGWEEYKNLLSRLSMKKEILVAEDGGKLQGYSIARAMRLFGYNYALNLFVPISKDFNVVCKALLTKAFRPTMYKRKNRFDFLYVGKENSKEHLEKLGFEVKEFLFCYRFL